MAALTVYPTGTAAATVSTANTLVTTPPGSETSKTSKTGKSTGWGVLQSQGNSTAWSAGASEPAFGDTHGFILDNTSLEGLNITAGTWTCKAKVSTSSGTVTGVVHVRCGVRHSNGTFTEIVNCAAPSTGFTSTAAVVTATGSGVDTAFATGDKLYIQVELQITANSSSSTTATTSLFENLSTTESIATPGTYALVTGGANFAATALEHAAGFQTAKTGSSLTSTATLSAAGIRTVLAGSHLTSTATFSASGTVTGSGPATVTGGAAFTATASIHAAGTRTTYGACQLTATATLHSAGVRTTYSGLTCSSTAALHAAGTQTAHGSITYTAHATLAATPAGAATSTDTPIDSFAWKTSIYRKDADVPASDECVTALPQLFVQSAGAKTATTSFVYYDTTLRRHRAVWTGDKVGVTDNAYLVAPNNFA